MESFSIQLPLPPREVSQNAASPGNWRRKAKATKEYRTLAKMESLATRVPMSCPWRSARVSIFFYYPDRRRRDLLNFLASCKAAIDGIVDADVLVDDDEIKLGAVDFAIDAADPRVLIYLERLDHGPDPIRA